MTADELHRWLRRTCLDGVERALPTLTEEQRARVASHVDERVRQVAQVWALEHDPSAGDLDRILAERGLTLRATARAGQASVVVAGGAEERSYRARSLSEALALAVRGLEPVRRAS